MKKQPETAAELQAAALRASRSAVRWTTVAVVFAAIGLIVQIVAFVLRHSK